MTCVVRDTEGRLVARPFAGFQEAGEHAIVWQAVGVSAGVYFCRISTRTDVSCVRLVKVR